MAKAEHIPDWVKTLSEEMAHTIEFPAAAHVGWIYEPPDKNESGVHVIILYPEPDEIQEAGPKDGELIFPIANGIDILTAQRNLDEVTSIVVQFEQQELPAVSFEGKYQGQAVMILMQLQPPPDDKEDETE